MNKKVLIVVIVVVALLLFAVWGYLLFTGRSVGPEGVFAPFPANNAPTLSAQPPPRSADTGVQAPPPALRQLSTRPAVGMVPVANAVRFVEAGTGHIFDVQVATGAETQVSITTVPGAAHAAFSPGGNRVVITGHNRAQEPTAGTITRNDRGDRVLDSTTLPAGARDSSFDDNGEVVRFALQGEEGIQGFAYNFLTGETEAVFTIPLRDVRIFYEDGQAYALTTPTAAQRGALYRIDTTILHPTALARHGFQAGLFGAWRLYTYYNEDGVLSSRMTTTTPGRSHSLPIAVFPQKCALKTETQDEVVLWCAAPAEYPHGRYPDDWYKGVVQLNDVLWEIRPAERTATLRSLFEQEVGRVIDVERMVSDPQGGRVFFTNKIDGALWVFEERSDAE